MKVWIIILLMGEILWGGCSPASAVEVLNTKEAVVKIYTVYQKPNYSAPWQMKGQDTRSGSGCIIKGMRILTNAHVVSDQVFIQVRRAGQTKKYTAEIKAVAHECDLAVLTVPDQSFFNGVEPIPLGKLPEVQDRVSVYGFPEGGDKLSITEGVVSRIEHAVYAHSNAFLLACQIDAAINVGNSGGPVIMDNQLVGVAFQTAGSMENVGYMVPTPVVEHFLKDIEDGRYDGIPCLGIHCQKLENPDIRTYLKLPEDSIGVMVTKVYWESPAEGILQTGDIILAVDKKPVGNDGTIEFKKAQRTFFEYAVQRKQLHEPAEVKIQRDGKIIEKQITLTLPLHFWRLVQSEQYDVFPTYYIAGGFVFAPLTVNYLKEWGFRWRDTAPIELVNYYLYGEKTVNRSEVVVMIKVLADELNVGYQERENQVIRSVNNINIASMRDLVRAFEQNRAPYHMIRDEGDYTIILDRQKTDSNGPDILKKYRINDDRSLDLLNESQK